MDKMLEQVRECLEAERELGHVGFRSPKRDALDLAALEKALIDAERYRWLRQSLTMSEARLKAWAKLDALDASIDAARSRTEGST